LQKVALQDQGGLNQVAKARGMNRDASLSAMAMMSPTGNQTIDFANIEVLTKIQKATQDANELIRQKYLRDVWRFEDLHK